MSIENLLKIYIKEVFIKHRALIKIISDQDPKFILVFWEYFTARQRI